MLYVQHDLQTVSSERFTVVKYLSVLIFVYRVPKNDEIGIAKESVSCLFIRFISGSEQRRTTSSKRSSH